MQRTIRISLCLVMLGLVTTPNSVQPTTASKGADVLGDQPHAAVCTLTAPARQPLLRPDRGPTCLIATATLPRGRYATRSMSAAPGVIGMNRALLAWRTHLPRSQAGEPPPGVGSPTLA
jgi:hypothetical protein